MLVLALLLLWARRPRTRAGGGGVLVAHTALLRSLPRFRSLARREQAVAALATLGAAAMVVGTVLLAARPTRPVTIEPDRNGRDIMLCLDVSASMDRWNLQVVASFRQLLSELDGERLGLTIFSGSSVAIFPLTDDYEYVDDRLDEAEAAFADGDFDYFTGAEARVPRASQTGDGLMSCLQRFEESGEQRGRAVVLASDNDPLGTGIFLLPEAAQEAVRDEVVLYGVGTPNMSDERAREFADAALTTGGEMTVVEDDGAVDDLVRAIQRLERERLESRATDIAVDDPATPFWVTLGGLGLLIGAALVGRRR
ncbi:hypothetical protein NPS01_30010 [Nocardioides psychrotolerans]|nr:hypothetical protein NPS01_30010 [Nocardioides psychrotolerans]